jgi:hypothetical protein
MTRRELLTAASAFVAAEMIPRAFSENTSDLDFRSALDVAARIKAKQVSSTELTTRMLARIDRYNPKINAFTYQMRDQALAQARRADAAVSRGDQVGPFHGVPICVKEAFGVKGEPDTWGIVALKGSKAPANSAAVERLLDSGAVLLGGTSVPLNLMDWQSFNDIYGTTNNPWDLTRTPGGSSGGSAAALAAGLSYLSIGSASAVPYVSRQASAGSSLTNRLSISLAQAAWFQEAPLACLGSLPGLRWRARWHVARVI